MIPAELPSKYTPLRVRLRRFIDKPWADKVASAKVRWRALSAGSPSVVSLSFGARWLGWEDSISREIIADGFENAERRFVQKLLRPGMTVLDIGAHHGLYTLLASRIVGARGRVIAFEPSSRERRKLWANLLLNGCTNVRVQSLALGEEEGEAELFLVDGVQTGCNSLRPPAVDEPTHKVRVRVAPLDDWLRERGIAQVDFVKLDVEGAELGVLKGAKSLLSRPPRPLMLVEVYDIRTEPWGYKAKDIVTYLGGMGYRWFLPQPAGELVPVDAAAERFDDNFVAVPEEKTHDVRELVGAGEHGHV
jgi:FkbM family methyltransferase